MAGKFSSATRLRYSNRIEIKNPGHSLVPDEKLGSPGSKTRNPKIAAVLHEVGLAETKGTGIRVMREKMERANLTLPLFESDRVKDDFTVRLLVHHLLSNEDVEWLAHFRDCNLSDEEARALVLLRELGAINNSVFRTVNHVDTLTASGHLRKMRDQGLLTQLGKGSTTYYTPGSRLDKLEREPKSTPEHEPLREELESLRKEPDSLRKELSALRNEIPEILRDRLEGLGERTNPAVLDDLIISLCLWRPLTLNELSALVGRSTSHLRSRHLIRLQKEKKVAFFYTDEPTHPDQKYTANADLPF